LKVRSYSDFDLAKRCRIGAKRAPILHGEFV